MVRTSVLNDALKTIYNAEKIGKRQVLIRPSSKVIIKVLLVMQKHGMIISFICNYCFAYIFGYYVTLLRLIFVVYINDWPSFVSCFV